MHPTDSDLQRFCDDALRLMDGLSALASELDYAERTGADPRKSLAGWASRTAALAGTAEAHYADIDDAIVARAEQLADAREAAAQQPKD